MAAIVHVPNPTMVTFEPKTVQTAGVMLINETASEEEADAVNGMSDELNVCEPGLAKLIDWFAWVATVNEKFCVAELLLAAVMVTEKVPAAVGVPESTPVDERESPAGRPIAENVIVAAPLAVTLNVFGALMANVVDAALVNTGTGLLFNVRLAAMGVSVGAVVAPQVPSASTATVETLLRLMT